MPLTYKLYPGNKITIEDSALMPGVDETLKTLGQSSLTAVGDSKILSEKNLSALEQRNLFYIVGNQVEVPSKVLTGGNPGDRFHEHDNFGNLL